jgi:hypothetical protein
MPDPDPNPNPFADCDTIVCYGNAKPTDTHTPPAWSIASMAKLSGGWSVKSDAGVTHAKAAKVFLDGSCRCICVEVLCRAVLERSPCSLLFGRTRPSMRRWVRCQCVGPTIPDLYDMWLAAMLFKPALLSHSMKWQKRGF